MEKGVRNARRKATDGDKHVKHHRGETSEKQAAKARQTDKMIERLDVVDEPLVDAFSREVPDWPTADVRTLLAKFGLRADHVERTVDELSPGERTRAGLALLQACGTNVLVLDEPTNHLDLPAIEQLEEALESYEGALLLVTHDRRLLENVRLDVRWNVDNGTVTELMTGATEQQR